MTIQMLNINQLAFIGSASKISMALNLNDLHLGF